MNEFQYLDFPAKEAWQREEHCSAKGQEVDVLLAEARNSLLSLKGRGELEMKRHLDKVREILVLCASFFSEADSKGVLLISGRDREELMIAENIFNSFRKELSLAKDEKLQKLIAALTPELQLPLSPAAIKQMRSNAAARAGFLENQDTYSSRDIYRLNGSTASNKAALASGWRSKGKIFAIDYKGNLYYPSFQFDNDAKPRNVIADVIKYFGKENAGWQLALWFITPNSVLDGKTPVEVVDSNPTGLIKAVKEETDPTLC